MKKVGFNDKWLHWMQSIFNSGKSSVILNGTPGSSFLCKCGVRQGDPLSPLIFVIAADLLQSAINEALRNNILDLPIQRDTNGDYPVIQYADDTLIILPACTRQLTKIKEILEDYATSVGLKINFHKSTLVPINTPPDKCKELAELLGCTVGSMPFTYLGLPLGTTRPTVLDLAPLVCKAERNITASMSLMSYAGKLALMNSLVTSLIMFTMGTIRIPPKIVAQLDKIRRHCLWQKRTEDGTKSNSLAAWDMVCRPKKNGGLGVVNLKIQNDALLLKFLHKFYNRHDIPWVHLIWDSYYGDSIPHAHDACGSFWWKDLTQLMPIYRGVTHVKIGNGSSTLFWKDNWSQSIYADSCPRAYSYAISEDVSVQHIFTSPHLQENFHLPLSIQAHDELRSIQLEVAENTLTEEHDTWQCIWGGNTFQTSSYYRFYFRDVTAHEAFGWLWKAKCTPKLKTFGWFLLVDRLNTRNMLKRRHYNIGTNFDCLLCGQHVEETVEHLFFHCTFSQECWLHLGFNWSLQHDRLDMIKHQKTVHPRKMWMDIFLTSAWSLWKERNNHHFRKIKPSVASWKQRFKLDFDNLRYRVKPSKQHIVSAIVGSIQ